MRLDLRTAKVRPIGQTNLAHRTPAGFTTLASPDAGNVLAILDEHHNQPELIELLVESLTTAPVHQFAMLFTSNGSVFLLITGQCHARIGSLTSSTLVAPQPGQLLIQQVNVGTFDTEARIVLAAPTFASDNLGPIASMIDLQVGTVAADALSIELVTARPEISPATTRAIAPSLISAPSVVDAGASIELVDSETAISAPQEPDAFSEEEFPVVDDPPIVFATPNAARTFESLAATSDSDSPEPDPDLDATDDPGGGDTDHSGVDSGEPTPLHIGPPAANDTPIVPPITVPRYTEPTIAAESTVDAAGDDESDDESDDDDTGASQPDNFDAGQTTSASDLADNDQSSDQFDSDPSASDPSASDPSAFDPSAFDPSTDDQIVADEDNSPRLSLPPEFASASDDTEPVAAAVHDTGAAHDTRATNASASIGPVSVLGVSCGSGHHNHPDAVHCSQCGAKMVANDATVLINGPRPPLGLLVVDDGATWSLNADLILGREPSGHPDVLAGRATAMTLHDDSLSLSRQHARIMLNEWTVQVIDMGSSNGTYINRNRANQEWAPVSDDQPTTVQAGDRVRVGGRIVQIELHHVR